MKSPHGCREIRQLFDLVEIISIRSRNKLEPRYFAAVGAGKNNRMACHRFGSIECHIQICKHFNMLK